MDRLTETKFDKEMRIGFSKIDRIFDDAISKLDAMKAEYEKKIAPKSEKLMNEFYALVSIMQSQAQLRGLYMGERNYASLQQMPMSFDRGQNDMSVAAQWSMGRFGQAMPAYRSPFIGLSDIA